VTTTCLAASTAPGELLRRIADGLAHGGLDVRLPDNREGRLDFTCPGARCTLTVDDSGHVEWEYCPWPPQDADPGLTADLATALLTGRTGPQPRPGRRQQREDITFRGLVGLEMKARGLNVELAVYADEDVFAEIVATVPGDDAQVRVTDDGGLTWTRDYQAAPAPAAVAGSVADAVTRAMSFLRPAEARRASHG
jgi:hypothetical protein